MENAAIKEIIYRHNYAALPPNADSMIINWISRNPADWMPKLTADFFGVLAARPLRAPRDPSAGELAPQLVFSYAAEEESSAIDLSGAILAS